LSAFPFLFILIFTQLIQCRFPANPSNETSPQSTETSTQASSSSADRAVSTSSLEKAAQPQELPHNSVAASKEAESQPPAASPEKSAPQMKPAEKRALSAADKKEYVARLVSLGFAKDASLKMLEKTKWDLNEAVFSLFELKGIPRPSPGSEHAPSDKHEENIAPIDASSSVKDEAPAIRPSAIQVSPAQPLSEPPQAAQTLSEATPAKDIPENSLDDCAQLKMDMRAGFQIVKVVTCYSGVARCESLSQALNDHLM
jgi:hypothetical protein